MNPVAWRRDQGMATTPPLLIDDRVGVCDPAVNPAEPGVESGWDGPERDAGAVYLKATEFRGMLRR